MTLEFHKLYKHDNCTDVAFELKGLGEAAQSYLVLWWNIVHKPHEIQRQVIFLKSLEGWQEFTPGVTPRRTKRLPS